MKNTKVVCVKVKEIRPLFDNLKDWSENSSNVYIGRKGIVFVNGERYPKKDSIWANPFKLSKESDRKTSLKKYEIYIREKIVSDGDVYDLFQLKGKNLGCWCKDSSLHESEQEACHGDVLVNLMDEYRYLKNSSEKKLYFSLKEYPEMEIHFKNGNVCGKMEGYSLKEMRGFLESYPT